MAVAQTELDLGDPLAGVDAEFRVALSSLTGAERLRWVLALHRRLRPIAPELAGPFCRLALTGFVAGRVSPRATRRARKATAGFLQAGRFDWACRSMSQEGRLALVAGEWALARQLLTAAERLGSVGTARVPADVRASMLSNLASAAWHAGDFPAARAAWEQALVAAQAHGLPSLAAGARAGLGLCEWVEGRPAAGYVYSSAALNWYRASGRTVSVAQVLCNAAMMLEDFGHWQDAVVLFEEARDLAIDANRARLAVDACTELVHAWIALRKRQRAREALVHAKELHTAGQPLPERCLAELHLAEGHLLLVERRVNDALRSFRQAHSMIGTAHRPILTQRVMTELNLAVQTAGGRLHAVQEMLEVVRAMDRRPVVRPLASR